MQINDWCEKVIPLFQTLVEKILMWPKVWMWPRWIIAAARCSSSPSFIFRMPEMLPPHDLLCQPIGSTFASVDLFFFLLFLLLHLDFFFNPRCHDLLPGSWGPLLARSATPLPRALPLRRWAFHVVEPASINKKTNKKFGNIKKKFIICSS